MDLNYETATVDDFVAHQLSFNELPENIRVQLLGNNREIYDKLLKNYSIERQLPYEDSQVKNVMSKRDYYTEMINNLKTKLRVCIFFIYSIYKFYTQIRFTLTNLQILLPMNYVFYHLIFIQTFCLIL